MLRLKNRLDHHLTEKPEKPFDLKMCSCLPILELFSVSFECLYIAYIQIIFCTVVCISSVYLNFVVLKRTCFLSRYMLEICLVTLHVHLHFQDLDIFGRYVVISVLTAVVFFFKRYLLCFFPLQSFNAGRCKRCFLAAGKLKWPKIGV